MKKIYVFLLLICAYPFQSFAQSTSGPLSGGSGLFESTTITRRYCSPCKKYHSGTCPPTQNVPIDGGLSLLLAAGAAYGVKRRMNKEKKTVASK